MEKIHALSEKPADVYELLFNARELMIIISNLKHYLISIGHEDAEEKTLLEYLPIVMQTMTEHISIVI